jgi:hypothetical protein
LRISFYTIRQEYTKEVKEKLFFLPEKHQALDFKQEKKKN